MVPTDTPVDINPVTYYIRICNLRTSFTFTTEGSNFPRGAWIPSDDSYSRNKHIK